MNKAGRNALVMSAIVCCGYVICFTPLHIASVTGYNTKAVDFGSWYYNVLTVLMFSNSIINPFIYAAKYRDFQEGVKRLMQKLKPNNQSQVTSVT